MKLTLVSVWYAGKRTAVFAQLPMHAGTARVDIEKMFKAVGIYIPAGCTFAIGV